jgi:hypothetical protein
MMHQFADQSSKRLETSERYIVIAMIKVMSRGPLNHEHRSLELSNLQRTLSKAD